VYDQLTSIVITLESLKLEIPNNRGDLENDVTELWSNSEHISCAINPNSGVIESEEEHNRLCWQLSQYIEPLAMKINSYGEFDRVKQMIFESMGIIESLKEAWEEGYGTMDSNTVML
jgi:hypothetical protein